MATLVTTYLGDAVVRLSRCPYPAPNDVLPVAAEEWELHAQAKHPA